MADLVDTFIARLQVQGEDAAGKLQSAINRLSAEMDKQTGAAERNATANKKAAASTEGLAGSDEKITKAKRTTTNELDKWIARMDKASKLALDHRNALERLQRMEDESVGTATQLAFAKELVNKKYQDGLALLNKTTAATVENTKALADNLTVQERINRVTGVTRGPAGPTPPPPKSATDLRNEDIQAYGRELDALRAKYNPLFAAEERHKEELAEINHALAVGAVNVIEHAEALDKETRAYQKQVTEIKAKKTALDAERAAERAAPSPIQERINATTGVSGGSDPATRTADIEAYANELDQLQAKYDPLFAAQRRFEAEQEEINRALKVGAINVEIHRTALNKAEDAYTGQIVKIKGAAAATDTHNKALTDVDRKTAAATRGTGQFNAAVTNLGFQVNDLATGLLSGQSPFTLAAQQGGQIMQAFSQGGGASAVIKGFADSVKSAITPTTLLAGGVITLVGSIVLLALRQAETEARLRQYNVSLDIMGAKSETTAEDLEKVTRALRDQGVEAGEAGKAINALVQTPGVAKGAIGDLAQLALNISGSRGGNLASTMASLGKAVAGTADDLENFNLELGVKYTDAENKAITASKIARDDIKQRAIEYQALQRTYQDANEKNKSEFQKQVDALKKTWQEFLDLMGPPALSIVSDFFKEFNQFIKDTRHELELLKQAYEWVKSKLPSWGGDDPTGARAAAEAQQRGARGGTDLSAPKVGDSSSMQQGIQFFLNKGLALEHAVGIVSRLALESGGGTALVPSAVNPDSGAYGIAQSLGSRQPAYKAAGDNLQAQLEVVWTEFTTTEINAFREILKTTTAKDAAIAMEAFERAKNPEFTAKGGELAVRVMETNKGLTAAPGTPAYLPPVETTARDPNAPTGRGKIVLDNQQRQIQIDRENMGLLGRDAALAAAKVAALTQVLNENMSPKEKDAFVTAAMAAAAEKYDKDLQANLTTEKLRTQGIEKTTAAILEGEVPGLKAAAEAAAVLDVRLGNAADVRTQTQAILARGAAEAINQSAKALPVIGQQIEQSERLVKATANGTKAEHEAVLANQVATATHEALTKAIAGGNPEQIKQAEAVTKVTAALIKRNDVAQQTYQLEQQINQRNNQTAIIQKTTELQGQTSEEIQRQVSLLQAKQDLEARGLTTSDAIYQKTLQNVDALGKANIKLAETERAQKAIDDAVKGVADTVSNELTDALGNAFSGKKVQDWGATVKSTLNDIIKQLAQGAIIKPIIGSILTSMGFGSVGAQFGSIGGTLSAASNMLGLGGLGASGGSPEVVNSKGDVIGTVSSGASVLKSGGGLLEELGLSSGSGSGGLFSGVSDFFSGGLGGVFAHAPTAADFAAGVGPVTSVPGSLFGSTTLGAAAGGIGLGFAGGSLLNTVLGGNQMGGTIGSGIGSVTGMAIGSIFGGPLVGGLLGGLAGGGLGGLFGGTKKPDQASGGVINLATGQIQNAQSGGNAQNDATASRIGTVLSAAVTRALAIPGARLPGGAVSVQAGSRDGIKLGFGGQSFKFDSAEAAIAAGLNALRDNLTGVSDTVQKVIHSIGDPAQIEGALAFAEAYEKLATAADSAFSEIEKDAKKVGPFETALQQIHAAFDSLQQQAEGFGLSVEPVDKALAEATRRLNEDFARAVDTAFNQATGRDFLGNVQDVIDGYEQMARDASALGSDRAIHDKLGATFTSELNTIFSALSGPQLDEVINQFGNLTNGLPELARAAKAAAEATAALARETERQAAAYQIQQDFDQAAGQEFLAQLRDLDRARIAAQANAAKLDLGEGRQGVIAETEHRAALNILQGLTNEQLEVARKTLAELNPAFSRWVDEAKAMAKASNDAADAQARSAQILKAQADIQAYLNSLQTQSSVFTSGKGRLEAAQSQYNTMLTAAQGGDATALEGITQAAQTLLQNVSDYYASSAPGQAIFQQVQAQLQGLLGATAPARVTATTADVVTAIEDTGIDTTAAIGSGSAGVVNASILASQKVTDNAVEMSTSIINAAKKANDNIVAVTISSGADMTNATLEGTALIVGGTAQGFAAQTQTLMTGTGTVVTAATGTTNAVVQAGVDATTATHLLLDNNVKNAGELIANNTQNALDTIAANENNAGLLRDASISQTNAILASNVASAETITQRATDTTNSLIGANDNHTTRLTTKAQETTNQTVAAAQTNTAALMAQNDASTQESIATLNASTASIVDTASAKSDALFTKTAAIGDAAAALSAANTTALAAKADQQIESTAAALATTTSTLDVAQQTATAAVVANTSASTDKAIGAQQAASAAVAAQATADSNAVMATQAAWSAYSIDQATAASNAAAASASGDAQAIIASQVAWDNAIVGNMVGWLQAAINSQVAWDNAINNSIVAWLNLTVNTIAAYGNALLGQGGGNAGYVAGYIAAYGQATIDTIGAHIRWLVDVIADKFNWLVGTVGAWGGNVFNQIAVWSQGIINQVGGSIGWLSGVMDNMNNGQIWTIASWSNAIISSQVAWDTSISGTLNWGFNSVIAAEGNVAGTVNAAVWGAINNLIGANWGNANWINGTLNVYGNAIIGNIAGTSNNEIGAIYGAANSIMGTIANHTRWLVDTENNGFGTTHWWLSVLNGSLGNINGNEVAWSQNLYNIMADIRNVINYQFERQWGELLHQGNYLELLTEVTIRFDEWMAGASGAQLDAMNAIQAQLRKNAFG